jgi:hypothetical protein
MNLACQSKVQQKVKSRVQLGRFSEVILDIPTATSLIITNTVKAAYGDHC